MSLSCAGALLVSHDVDDLLRRASSLPEEIVLMDADMVCGHDHLESAVVHARRAFDRGSNAANTLGMEVILYASGERQISKAKKKMGLRPGTERVAVVVLSPEDSDMDRVLGRLGLERDDDVLKWSPDKGSAFGLDPSEMEAVGPDRAPDLALEKVAFVELLKR